MIAQLVFENASIWILGLPLAVAALGLSARAQWKRGTSGPRIGLLTSLRSVTLLILLCLAARPARTIPQSSGAKRDHVVLLVDQSKSMSLEDNGEERYGQAVSYARNELLPALKAAGIRTEAALFAEDVTAADGARIANAKPRGTRTNLARAIARTVIDARHPPLAVIALTDGIATEQLDDARATIALVENNVPFIGVGFGSETETRILSLEQAMGPNVSAPNQEFSISAQLRATGNALLPPFDLVLLRDRQFVEKKSLSISSGARMWHESFQVTETAEGLHSYTVQLLPPAGDSISCPRTEATVAVRIVDEKRMRVLFLQGGLTWDYKFIRLALQGDSSIALSGLSRVSSKSTFVQSVDDADELVGGFPPTLEQLAKFNVIVLSNLTPNDLTTNQQELVSRFCREYGGGVLMIGGAKTFSPVWQHSVLETLLPVRFAHNPRAAFAGRGSFKMQISESALALPVFQISETGDNRNAWASLPTFQYAAVVDRVKPGAEIWAVRQSPRGSSDAQVLMAAERFGAGMSAVICVPNFWRWRLAKTSNPRHFDRFWQQLLRYLMEATRNRVVLRLPDQQLQPDTDARITLERRPDPRKGQSDRQYRFRVTDEHSKVVLEQAVRLRAGQSTTITFRLPHRGVFTASVLDQQNTVVAHRSLEVQNVDRELIRTARDMETLRQWAARSGGLAIGCEDSERSDLLVDAIETRLNQPQPAKAPPVPLGINGWVLALLLACLCAEWLLRKRWGLS